MRSSSSKIVHGGFRGPGLRIAATVLCAMALTLSSNVFEDQHARADQGVDGDPRQRTIEPGEYVLIYRDAAFYETPGEPDRSHRAYPEDRQRASEPFEQRVVAKAVADHGDWVVVERSSGSESLVCDSRGFNQDASVRLRFFVPRDDLALAIRHPTSREYDDGTKVEMLPGVAVESSEDGEHRYRAWHEELDFAADVSPEDVGLGFEPEKSWEKEWDDLIAVELDDRATVGDALLSTESDESVEVFAQKVELATRSRSGPHPARLRPGDGVGSRRCPGRDGTTIRSLRRRRFLVPRSSWRGVFRRRSGYSSGLARRRWGGPGDTNDLDSGCTGWFGPVPVTGRTRRCRFVPRIDHHRRYRIRR